MAKGKIHLRVSCRLDAASRIQEGMVVIDRERNIVTVRRKRSRTTWEFLLDDAIQILVERAIRAEVLRKRLEKANKVKEKKREQRELRRIRRGG